MSSPDYIDLGEISIVKLLLKYLEELEGVERLFGVPGASFKDLLNEMMLEGSKVTYVVCKHETGAGYMADGFHRVSGKLGVVVVTSGPGATNALTGAMNGQSCMSSLLVITGEQDQKKLGLGWEQEGVDMGLDINQIYKSAVRYSAMINAPEDFDVLLRQALRDAQGIPSQTTHLSIPSDVMGATVRIKRFPTSTDQYRASVNSASPDDVRSVLDQILNAKRPMILVGNGMRDVLDPEGLEKFQSFVECFGIPVGTTADAKGLFPESHDLALRSCGYPACEWPAYYFTPPQGAPDAAPYDGLLVLGSSLGNFATDLWNPKMIPAAGPFIQVDADQSVIGRSMPITMGVVAELGAFLGLLADMGNEIEPDEESKSARLDYLAWLKETYSAYFNPDARKSDDTPIRPERAMALVSELLPPGSHIFPDAGNSCGWTATYLDIDPPTRIHAALDVGAMGYGTAAVVGAKMADPDATCICIGGDGSLMMHGTEISTATQYKAGAIWMVWNEDDLHMVSQGINGQFPNDEWRDYFKLGNPDLVKFAEGLGAEAYLVHSPSDMRDALEKAIKGGQKGRPQVIVVREDPEAVPPFRWGRGKPDSKNG